MNNLESLKSKLKLKPRVDERKQVAIVIKKELSSVVKPLGEEENQILIIDKRDTGYDRKSLIKKMADSKISKVSVKPIIQIVEESQKNRPIQNDNDIKKPKKIKQKLSLIFEEEPETQTKGETDIELQKDVEEDKEAELQEAELQEAELQEAELQEAELQAEVEPKIQPDEEEEIIIKIPKRRTKKIEKGIAILGPETFLDIGDTSIQQRVPKKKTSINIKVSSYYMNNREIFVNFINSLFEPYKKELEENSENISCDTIGQSNSNFSLLTHQKIVRDYLNLYTPYRGLLLYHGLGSGKTCTSVAIAEGMKDVKRVIIMTPASLRTNYMEELKKCGDLLYKKNQFWEWISTITNPEAANVLSGVLNLPLEFIKKRKGAWFVNVKKQSNFDVLNSVEKKSLDEQLDEMIRNKYTFINYNGLRTKRLEELSAGFTKNIFDNSVVIIDEAHNLVSRIVNKIKKEKIIVEDKRTGEKENSPKFLSTKLYEYLLSAQNARIVLLTGTPIINYPNEFGILFNILRGYIKTWEFPLDIKITRGDKKVDKNYLYEILQGEKTLDFIDYSPSSKVLTVTRNPFGFKNKIKKDTGYQGVSNNTKDEKGETNFNSDFVSNEDFERKIISILKRNDIDILPIGIKIRNKKALPDTLELFEGQYIDSATKELKNIDSLKRRIIGLSSYFKSAQESLLPKFNKTLGVDYHVIRIPMSDFQFKIYENARKEERKSEKPAKKTQQVGIDGLYKEPSSTYRIFSRLFCNYVMKDRPIPLYGNKKKDDEKDDEKDGEKDGEKDDEKDDEKDYIKKILKEAKKREENQDINDTNEAEVEGDEILDEIGGVSYKQRIDATIQNLKNDSNNFLTPEALETFSPKFLHILENIKDTDHLGLHLIYSQFRTLEGIGIFSLVLDKNGFTRFKIKKNNLDVWEVDIQEEDLGKPTYALYTGTETAEEKEIIRNIYNGEWNYVPITIVNQLKKIANNNNMGEIIKVLMITSSGSEGINLRNTRYVHIMEPYWHPVRMEQVIGRARRICSHKSLPLALQTVEVFVYLMIFSAEQLKSDDAIELKRKDLSKGEEPVPLTSDQYLYEISEIKGKLTRQLTDMIKETAFDCYIYSNGKCLNFGEPKNDKFSYIPDYTNQQNDTTMLTNKREIQWIGKPITLNGVDYIYKRINKSLLNIYDKTSYLEALQTTDVNPSQIGTLEINQQGQQVFKQLVT
jgi:hypothetical protein